MSYRLKKSSVNSLLICVQLYEYEHLSYYKDVITDIYLIIIEIYFNHLKVKFDNLQRYISILENNNIMVPTVRNYNYLGDKYFYTFFNAISSNSLLFFISLQKI